MDILKLLCLSTGIMGGLIAVSYQQIAEQKGWTIGRWFINTRPSWFLLISLLLEIAACIMSFQTFDWWQAILIILSSWLLAVIATFSLKSFVQYLSLLLTLTSVVLYFISFGTIYRPEKQKIQSASSEVVSNNEDSRYDTSSAKAGSKLNDCNCEVLNSRKLVTVQSDEEKRKVIYLFCISILTDLNEMTAERDKLDDISVNNLNQGKKVDYNDLFEKIDAAIKKIENRNQMPETNLLDQLAFCRLQFEKEKYSELESLENNNLSNKERPNKVRNFFNTYSPLKDEKDRKLNEEVERLINKYDLKNVSL